MTRKQLLSVPFISLMNIRMHRERSISLCDSAETGPLSRSLPNAK